jgi:hypothetical protein
MRGAPRACRSGSVAALVTLVRPNDGFARRHISNCKKIVLHGVGEGHCPKGRATVKWAVYKLTLTLPLEELFSVKNARRNVVKTV